ncbi:MAG: arylsulfatase [bacterium]|nr:arylsulfatase [bacterium]
MGQLAAADQRPNFLIIIADDMGFSDAGCYGGEIRTPNLDALAEQGVRFTQFYNTARCWPTRGALLTGFYPQQIGRDGMPTAPRSFGGSGKRPSWAKTIAEYLKPAGYRTYHSGKWHVDGKPLENGFDLSDETSRGPGFFDGLSHKDRDPNYYRTIHTAQHAIDCLQQHAREFAGQPFFHYLAFHAPHFPLHALPEDIAVYDGVYDDGWDALRTKRHAKQRQLGITSTDLSALEPEVGPPYDFPEQLAQLGEGEINRPLAWKELSATQRQFQSDKMEIHAAMIDRMDQEIGRVVDQLRKMQVLDNTFICFLSDNGASAEIMVRGDGHDPQAPMGSAASYLCLGPGFSSAANTPFRRHKTWVHEGGISTPFIVRWPEGTRERNVLRGNIAHVIDIAPTVLDLAGVELPADPDRPEFPGMSLRSALAGQDLASQRELWFYHEGNRALRVGDWKIVHANAARGFPWARSPEAQSESLGGANWQLYNLATDRAEQQDLSAVHRERVDQMSQRWQAMGRQFLDDAGVR